MTKAQEKKPPFHPYFASCDMGAVAHNSGINWSYATFETEAACDAFEKAYNENDYRTRNKHSTHSHSNPDLTQPERWSVQYHHY